MATLSYNALAATASLRRRIRVILAAHMCAADTARKNSTQRDTSANHQFLIVTIPSAHWETVKM